MPIRKLEDGRYEVDCRPEGRYWVRVRRIFRTKNEAQNFRNRVMGEGAKGTFEKAPKHDTRKLQDLVDRWFAVHGKSLKTGKQRLALLTNMVERMGNPKVGDFTASTFAQYRSERACIRERHRERALSKKAKRQRGLGPTCSIMSWLT
ncbi:phage integrase [Pseudomonas proteolytica]|uniref:phage integrase n=1 Tax=Pseudomonas proteolytica TaxID=219574 RepID=UPI00320AA753